jgi:flagellar biosynthesis GTPase FlhF
MSNTDSERKGKCVGRMCGDKKQYALGAAFRYTEKQCARACLEGSNLCGVCTKHEEANMAGKPGTWHGRMRGPIPNASHIEGSKWNIDTRVKEAAKAAKAAGGAGAPAEAKKAAADAKKAEKEAAAALKAAAVAEKKQAMEMKRAATAAAKAEAAAARAARASEAPKKRRATQKKKKSSSSSSSNSNSNSSSNSSSSSSNSSNSSSRSRMSRRRSNAPLRAASGASGASGSPSRRAVQPRVMTPYSGRSSANSEKLNEIGMSLLRPGSQQANAEPLE